MNALEIKVKDTFGTDLSHVSNEQIYVALLEMVKEEAAKKVSTCLLYTSNTFDNVFLAYQIYNNDWQYGH